MSMFSRAKQNSIHK